VCVAVQSGAASKPPDTFSHSTTTVPLNRACAIGRRTSRRVVYGAVLRGDADHLPSGGSSAALA
jgi:hypothetical protein